MSASSLDVFGNFCTLLNKETLPIHLEQTKERLNKRLQEDGKRIIANTAKKYSFWCAISDALYVSTGEYKEPEELMTEILDSANVNVNPIDLFPTHICRIMTETARYLNCDIILYTNLLPTPCRICSGDINDKNAKIYLGHYCTFHFIGVSDLVINLPLRWDDDNRSSKERASGLKPDYWTKKFAQYAHGIIKNDSMEENIIDNAKVLLDRLRTPASLEKNMCGVAIGKVQSGKTMNMMALTALALDNGYKAVFILSEGNIILRLQNQMRFENCFGCNMKPEGDGMKQTLVWLSGRIKNSQNTGFVCKCAEDNNNCEIKIRHVDSLDVYKVFSAVNDPKDSKEKYLQGLKEIDSKLKGKTPDEGSSQYKFICVGKKNIESIGGIENFVIRYNLNGEKILIIDDECDSKSIKAAHPPKKITSPVAEKICKLITSDSRKFAYIGYTATPQANILTDPSWPIKAQFFWPLELYNSKSYVGLTKLFSDGEEHPSWGTIDENAFPYKKVGRRAVFLGKNIDPENVNNRFPDDWNVCCMYPNGDWKREYGICVISVETENNNEIYNWIPIKDDLISRLTNIAHGNYLYHIAEGHTWYNLFGTNLEKTRKSRPSTTIDDDCLVFESFQTLKDDPTYEVFHDLNIAIKFSRPQNGIRFSNKPVKHSEPYRIFEYYDKIYLVRDIIVRSKIQPVPPDDWRHSYMPVFRSGKLRRTDRYFSGKVAALTNQSLASWEKKDEERAIHKFLIDFILTGAMRRYRFVKSTSLVSRGKDSNDGKLGSLSELFIRKKQGENGEYEPITHGAIIPCMTNFTHTEEFFKDGNRDMDNLRKWMALLQMHEGEYGNPPNDSLVAILLDDTFSFFPQITEKDKTQGMKNETLQQFKIQFLCFICGKEKPHVILEWTPHNTSDYTAHVLVDFEEGMCRVVSIYKFDGDVENLPEISYKDINCLEIKRKIALSSHHAGMLHNATEIAMINKMRKILGVAMETIKTEFENLFSAEESHIEWLRELIFKRWAILCLKRNPSSYWVDDNDIFNADLRHYFDDILRNTHIKAVHSGRGEDVQEDFFYDLNESFETLEDGELKKHLKYRKRIHSNTIFVGGTMLSRGLTLKGLLVSMLLRQTGTEDFDTYTQFCRYCGHKADDKDLLRVYMLPRTFKVMNNITKSDSYLRHDIRQHSLKHERLKEGNLLRIYAVGGGRPTAKRKMHNPRTLIANRVISGSCECEQSKKNFNIMQSFFVRLLEWREIEIENDPTLHEKYENLAGHRFGSAQVFLNVPKELMNDLKKVILHNKQSMHREFYDSSRTKDKEKVNISFVCRKGTESGNSTEEDKKKTVMTNEANGRRVIGFDSYYESFVNLRYFGQDRTVNFPAWLNRFTTKRRRQEEIKRDKLLCRSIYPTSVTGHGLNSDLLADISLDAVGNVYKDDKSKVEYQPKYSGNFYRNLQKWWDECGKKWYSHTKEKNPENGKMQIKFLQSLFDEWERESPQIKVPVKPSMRHGRHNEAGSTETLIVIYMAHPW